MAVGRRPSTAGIGLEAVGLEPGHPVGVDGQLRATSVPGGWLYAIGDCNGLAPFTHMGKYHGRIAAAAILGRDVADVASQSIVPRVTFTDPQVCAVGRTAAQARAEGLRVTVVSTPTGGVPGAYTQGNGIRGTSQLVIDDDSRTVVGATFTGPGLQELLHSATVAISGGVTVDRLWHAVPSFPTVSEVWLHLLRSVRPLLSRKESAMNSLPIGDYALLSDCRSAALVSRAGSVDWLCFPRFDAPSVFARILDPGGGHFAIRPAGDFQASRAYVDQTMALETTFRTATGTAVLTDAMAVGRNDRGHDLGAGSPGVLLRRLACTDGELEVEVTMLRGPNTA